MKLRPSLLGGAVRNRLASAGFGLAIVVGFGFASGACGDDDPSLQDGSVDAPQPAATFTTYVIDLINNHTSDPAPAPFADFKDLPDPDGDNNNIHAYDVLFP